MEIFFKWEHLGLINVPFFKQFVIFAIPLIYNKNAT